jgi:hypothetical protein
MGTLVESSYGQIADPEILATAARGVVPPTGTASERQGRPTANS